MGRGKAGVPSLIQDRKKRMVTFGTRKKCLEKKAYELSTLCDVDIAMIIFPPDDMAGGNNDPIIWPEDLEVTNRLINLYQSRPEHDRRDADVASVYQDRARIVGNEVAKLRQKNMEGKYPVWDECYESLSRDSLLKFGSTLDCLLEVLQSRIDYLTRKPQESNSSNSLGNNERALVLHNSEGMRNVDESLSCFGYEGALVGHNSIVDRGFNWFGNEEALAFHNSQNTKMMDESASCSNNNFSCNYSNNNNSIVPANFDHMVTNTNYDISPLPGFEDDFAWNNDFMVMGQPENHQYGSYEWPQQVQMVDFTPHPLQCIDPPQVQMQDFTPHPLQYIEPHQTLQYIDSPQVQMPDFTPRPLQCIDPPSDPYSQMVNNDIRDAWINQFGRNFNFQL